MSRFLRVSTSQGKRGPANKVSVTVAKQGSTFKASLERGREATAEYLQRKWGLPRGNRSDAWTACRRMTDASLCRSVIPYHTPFGPAAKHHLAYWALEPAR